MQWQNESLNATDNHYDVFTGIVVVLALAGLYLDRQLLFLFIGLLAIYIIGNRLYNRQLGKGVILENPIQLVRGYAGEEGQLKFTIKNDSYLPYLNGYLSFEMSHQIINKEYLHAAKKEWNLYYIPFSLPGKSEVTVTIPLRIDRRGIGRVKQIEYTFPHLLLYKPIVLKYMGRFQTEFLVYPKLQAVANLESIQNQHIGEDTAVFSPYEDLLQPVGTRNYVQSDPFQRIHWKASARSQKLQTKIYERNQQIAWTIVVNISKRSPLGNYAIHSDLEAILSETAYLCRWITKQDQPMEVYINGSIMTKYLHLKEDQGLRHLKRILEMVARVETGSRIYPLNNLLHHIQQAHNEPRKIVILGEYENSIQQQIHQLLKGKHQVYLVENSCLTPLTLKGKNRYGA